MIAKLFSHCSLRRLCCLSVSMSILAGCDLATDPLNDLVVTNEKESGVPEPATPLPPVDPNGKTLIELTKCEAKWRPSVATNSRLPIGSRREAQSQT